MPHPYKSFPPRQFWSRSVSSGFSAGDVGTYPLPLVERKDRIVTAGSCFAANLVPYLEGAGLTYLKTEFTNPIFGKVPPESLSYGKFSAGYGNIYTTRQLYQLLLRACGAFTPAEDRWRVGPRLVDPFRPGLTYAARSDREFDEISRRHLRAVRKAFSECSVFIFTLGLTEAWYSKLDGAVFPACPGTIAGAYDPDRHGFVNFTVQDVTDDLGKFVARLRSINPGVRIILTVSPVPLVATAEQAHVLAATTYSKSVLRVAAETAARTFDNIFYFPSYEIVTGPQAPEDFFESDRRDVSRKAVEVVMGAFLSACERNVRIPEPVGATSPDAAIPEQLSSRLAAIECEEGAQAL